MESAPHCPVVNNISPVCTNVWPQPHFTCPSITFYSPSLGPTAPLQSHSYKICPNAPLQSHVQTGSPPPPKKKAGTCTQKITDSEVDPSVAEWHKASMKDCDMQNGMTEAPQAKQATVDYCTNNRYSMHHNQKIQQWELQHFIAFDKHSIFFSNLNLKKIKQTKKSRRRKNTKQYRFVGKIRTKWYR